MKNIYGFVKYHCYFTCNDNLQKYNDVNDVNDIVICEGRGTSNGIIIMPYYSLGSIKTFNWSDNNFDQFKNIILQVVLSLYNAYLIEGFLHQDIHLENVLLKTNLNKKIEYMYPKITLYSNLIIKIIDFANSRLFDFRSQDTDKLFNADLQNFFIRIKLDLKFDNNLLMILNGNPENYILNLIETINKLEYNKISI